MHSTNTVPAEKLRYPSFIMMCPLASGYDISSMVVLHNKLTLISKDGESEAHPFGIKIKLLGQSNRNR